MLVYVKREVTSEGKCIGMIKYNTYCVVRYVWGDARSYTEAETAQFTTIDRLGPRPVELLASWANLHTGLSLSALGSSSMKCLRVMQWRPNNPHSLLLVTFQISLPQSSQRAYWNLSGLVIPLIKAPRFLFHTQDPQLLSTACRLQSLREPIITST